MNKPSEQKSTVTSELPNKLPETGELTDQELDQVAGGVGKAVTWAHNDESPKETVTFEYGGLVINYSQQD